MAAGISVARTFSPGGSSENPRTVTADGSVATGSDVLALGISSGAGTFTADPNGFTDSVGNTYTRDAATSSASSRIGVWRSFAITHAIVSGSTTFSLSSSGNSFKGIAVVYLTGGNLGSLDKTNTHGSQSTATPDTGTSGTLTNADEVAVAAYGWDSGDTFAETATYANVMGTPGLKMTTTSTVISGSWQWKETAATTALNPAATIGASVTDQGLIVVYTWTPAVTGVKIAWIGAAG